MRYSASKYGVTLKTGLGFGQGYWKWHYLTDRIRVPISVPYDYVVLFARYSDLLAENREIFIPHLYLSSSYGVTLSEFREVVTRKTRMIGLPSGEKIMTIY